ncbi:hypothetical protein BGZ83_001218 [Gryganskiella cystojenkinii]|nr:hypothetical protein BGZ83_001218 [Gryganskiella cystojenkinii]
MYLVERFHGSMKVSYAGEPADDPMDALVAELNIAHAELDIAQAELAIAQAVLAVGQQAQGQDDQNVDFLGPDLEAGLSPLLRLQLDQKRAAEQEARKVAREKALIEEFEHKEGELMEVMNQMRPLKIS